MSSEDEETQRRFAARGARGGSAATPPAAPVGGQRVLTRPGGARAAAPPPQAAAPVSHVAEVAAAAAQASEGPAPKRLSWYMPHEEWALMSRLRDELYHAAGAEGLTLEKQDACAALARAIAADFASIKHRALLDLQQRQQGR